MGHIRRALAGERWEVVEIPILRTNGTVRTVLWNSATLLGDDGKTAVATIAQGQDITERKRAGEEILRLNQALEERAAELEASNKELESFSYSVSHDLREPLRTVDGFSRILQKDYADKLDAEGQRLINIIRGGTQKMAKLISDLLSFSRIGRKGMELSEIDMVELVEKVSMELRSAVPERKLRFNIKKLPTAQGDPAMIRQVMINLLSNAIKFTREKRLAVIEVGSIARDGENIYYVKDNGVGFDPEYKDKLFRIFQRLHSEEEFEGTGVGLAIVQRIIHRHGGRVLAEGEVGHGATFYFTLPGKDGKS
jgi:light-regulated signal transduction histidine kinase (bacteriophytochrome)